MAPRCLPPPRYSSFSPVTLRSAETFTSANRPAASLCLRSRIRLVEVGTFPYSDAVDVFSSSGIGSQGLPPFEEGSASRPYSA